MSNSPTIKKVCTHPRRRARRERALARRTQEMENLIDGTTVLAGRWINGEQPVLTDEQRGAKVKIAKGDILNLNRKGITA